MLPEIVYGSFTTTSGPAAVNLSLGFIPDDFMCVAADDTTGNLEQLLYLGTAGTGKGWKTTVIADNGTTANKNMDYVSSSFITEYTASSTVNINLWAASTAYVVGNIVKALAPQTPSIIQAGTEYYFQCTSAGTSGSSEPTWTTDGSTTVTDSGVTWTPIAMGGSGTSFSPSLTVSKVKGVSIPSALLKASTTYHYRAIKAGA